jgi:hypothetical protein
MAGGRQAGGSQSIATPNQKINTEKRYDNRWAREGDRRAGGRGGGGARLIVKIFCHCKSKPFNVEIIV